MKSSADAMRASAKPTAATFNEASAGPCARSSQKKSAANSAAKANRAKKKRSRGDDEEAGGAPRGGVHARPRKIRKPVDHRPYPRAISARMSPARNATATAASGFLRMVELTSAPAFDSSSLAARRSRPSR